MIELLLSLILSWTGIARDYDPGLATIAERRAAEVSTDATWSHAGMDPCCYEVLAYSINHPSPVTAASEGWRTSTTGHREVLLNPTLTRIGCGHAVGADGRDVFACVLTTGGIVAPAVEPVEVARSPKPTPAGSTPAGGATALPVTMLPDTSMAGVAPGKHLRADYLWTYRFRQM